MFVGHAFIGSGLLVSFFLRITLSILITHRFESTDDH